MRLQYALAITFNLVLLYATYELYVVLEHQKTDNVLKEEEYTRDELLLQNAANTFSQDAALKTNVDKQEQPSIIGLQNQHKDWDPAIILFCFNRTEYLAQTLESLASLEGLHEFHIIISQDGDAEHVNEVVQQYGPHGNGKLAPPHSAGFLHLQRKRVPLLRPDQPGHAWLTQHYKFGLDALFLDQHHSHAVIVEDDMLFSPDFLQLLKATAPLLEKDPTLWCVSTWNDNGLGTFDWDDTKLFRTSYFPGLGWMMRRQLWLELGPHWPLENWDHWMRLETTAKGRDCVVPEVNRNNNIGEEGANMNRQQFKRYLAKMGWHQRPANETSYGDLSYLEKANYQRWVEQQLSQAQLWDWRSQRVMYAPQGGRYLCPYLSELYSALARQFRTWPFPRGHFHHALYLRWKGSVFWLADRRFCPLLAPEHQTLVHPQLKAIAGEHGQSCDDVCGLHHLQCSKEDFWFINSCTELKKHFTCERGCDVVLGPDVPNYVINPEQITYQQCLITQRQPLCDAAHEDTARLCPCITGDGPVVQEHPMPADNIAV